MKRFSFFQDRLINPSISPNLEVSDVLSCLKLIFSPLTLRSGNYVNRAELWFKYNFSARFAYTFSSAREAQYALLKSINIGDGDEVLVQAFTCAAAINPIVWIGAKPVYVDIDKKTLSMDAVDMKKKITKKTKVIILQHTFGIPGEIEKIKEEARKYKIFLVEDCAHTIGGIYKDKKLGTFGDAAIFSFGRDKAVSSVFGGVVITNRRKIADNIKKIKEKSPYPSHLWIYQQLMHPVCTYFVILGFEINPFIGKSALYLFKKIHLISKPIVPEENSDTFISKVKTRKFPNALAELAFNQLLRLNKFNKKRLDLFYIYKQGFRKLDLEIPDTEAFYLRVPAFVKKREKLFSFCKEHSIYLGDWYSNVIDPKNTNFERVSYTKGSCKVAEDVAKNIVNLPCYPRLETRDVDKVINTFKLFYGKSKKNNRD